jgi:hypothetical protein
MSALSGDGMLSVTQTGVAFVWDSVSRELEAWLVNDANSVEATYVIATLTGASDPQLDASDIFVY